MTRKRNQRRNVPTAVVQQTQPHMQQMAQMLSAEETGNFGVYYEDGRPNIRQVRNAERAAVAHFDDPRVMLPNPNARAPFDRTEPLGKVAKNEAFGFQVQPDRLIDLPPGDAGAGQSVYVRRQIFARLDDPATLSVAGNPMDKAIDMATYVSSDCRPRFWHVSFFGIAVQRVANAVPIGPLTESQILSEQLEPISEGAAGVANAPVSPDFIPAVTQLQARVMVFDESGQRFYDFDIMGNRSIDVYAWGVTVFILAPANVGAIPEQAAYNVNRGSGGNLPQTALGGLVEDAIIGARIVPIVINSTQNTENRTITVVTDPAIDRTYVPIPPGTRKVQVINHDSAAEAATWRIFFDAGDDGTFVGSSEMGNIDINVGESKSDVVLVPTCAQIIFEPSPGIAVTGWSLIFTVESQ